MKDEGDRGVGEECECGLGAKPLDGGIGSLKAPDGYFGVFEMSEYRFIEEVHRDPVDCDECWCEGGYKLEDLCETEGLEGVVKRG